MVSAFVITLREGLEASLIVGILSAYLVKTERRNQVPKLWIGVVAAIGFSIVAGVLLVAGTASLSRKQQELVEGITGLVAVAVLTWMIFWMRRHAHHFKESLHARIDAAVESGAIFTLIFLAFTAVAREGLETVLFLHAALNYSDSAARSGTAALLGLIVAAGLGYGLYRGGIRLNLKAFFQFTGGLLIVIAAGILASSIHELNEAGLLLFLGQRAWDTSSIASPGAGGIAGITGSILKGIIGYEPRPTVLQVIAYWGYLIPAMFSFYAVPAIRVRRSGATPLFNATQTPSEVLPAERTATNNEPAKLSEVLR